MDKNHPIFLSIEPTERNTITVSVGFSTFSHTKVDSGMISCYIPGFDISFSAKDQEAIDKKSHALVHAFIDYFFIPVEGIKQSKGGLKGITLELHKLGFKANDDLITVKKLINNEVVKAKFKSIESAPSYYSAGSVKNSELQMSVAV